MTYGTKRGSDFLIKLPSFGARKVRRCGDPPLNRFRVTYRKKDLGEFTLHVPGVHNVLNATAAIAVGVGLDVQWRRSAPGSTSSAAWTGASSLRGRVAGVSVIDDYGHHPTEIKATLAAARQCGFRKIHVVFQPHRYTRTRDLMEEFATAFGDADSLFVLDIYAASEKPIEGISGEALARTIREKGGRDARYVGSFAGCREFRRGRGGGRGHDPDPGGGQRFAVGADDFGEAEGAGSVNLMLFGGIGRSGVRKHLKEDWLITPGAG